MSFKAHCQFEIEVQGNIMVCIMKGLWNLEGVSDYFAELKKHAQLVSDSHWVRIADISEFEGGPIEIMDRLIEIQNWSVQHNCI